MIGRGMMAGVPLGALVSISASTPEGVGVIGHLWSDTLSASLKRCTALAPLTFITQLSSADVDVSHVPTGDEKDALGGTSGTPGSANKYVTNADARNTDARAPTSHGHAQADVTDLVANLGAKEATANKDAVSGYAGLNASSRVTKGTDTVEDLIIDLATKGVVFKDTQEAPHYWRLDVTVLGAMATSDLGTVKP